MRGAVFGLFLAFAVSSGVSVARDKPTHAQDINLEEMKTMFKNGGVVFLDANSSNMYEEGHVPGAIHFASAETDLAGALKKADPTKSHPIVAYCGGPSCSAWKDAAAAVEKLGYTNVKHFSGGITGWRDAGQPIEKGKSKAS